MVFKKGQRLSESNKGNTCRFKKGYTPWNKNKTGIKTSDKWTDEQKHRQSEHRKGKPTWASKHKDLVRQQMLGNTHGFKKGQLPHNFNNYSSFEPYGKEFDEELKEQIRKKYNYRCQECFRHQDELRTKTNKLRKLTVHHIDFNKKNNNENNLIPLCVGCHGQTLYDREKWIDYYQRKVI